MISLDLMSATLLALAFPCRVQEAEGDPASIQEVAAVQVLETARTHLREIRSARYFARHTVTFTEPGGSTTIASEGVVLVQAMDPGADPLGARVRIEGKLLAAGDAGEDVAFALTYDGAVVRARIESPGDASKVIWEAHPGERGDELLDLGRRLLVPDLYSPDPLGDELRSSTIVSLPEETINETRCSVVRLTFDAGEPSERRVEWRFGSEDHLPREMRTVREIDGVPTLEVLTLSQLVTTVEVDPSLFVMATPEGWTVEQYGRDEHHDHGLLEVGSLAPDWKLLDPDGKEHTLSALRGKVVVLDFWATWCGPCRMTMPAIESLHRRFQGKEVAVLGLSAWDQGEPARYMREKGYTYGLLLAADGVAEKYGVSGLPTIYVIGTDGRVLAAHVGFDEKAEKRLSRVISQHLEHRQR